MVVVVVGVCVCERECVRGRRHARVGGGACGEGRGTRELVFRK